MRILITGGAGYVGSFTARRLAVSGHEVVIVDDLSEGHIHSIESGWLVNGNFGDADLIRELVKKHHIEAVMHFGASTGEMQSNNDPQKYFQNNVINSLKLLNVLVDLKVKKVVFSSSAAFYDTIEESPLLETSPIKPCSCYAHTKLAIEHALEDYRRAYDIGYASLRYFNAAGASPDGRFGEDHRPETHLIPIVLQCPLGQRKEVLVYGDTFATPDGTTIRDYVHVEDIAQAHLLALENLEPEKAMVYNIGTGRGSSVLEVIYAVEKVTGQKIPTRVARHRPGDCAMRVANSRKIQQELGWQPKYLDIISIIKTAWAWHSSHPNGYSFYE